MKRQIIALGVLGAIIALASTGVGATTAPNEQLAWSSPSVMALKRISSVAGHQNEPTYLSNLDCTLETYRLVASPTMQTGCFTETAFGQIDSDSDTVIFNGTDEGLPLLPASAHQILAPWPRALNLVALDTTNTGGSLISMYKNPLSVLQDRRNIVGQLTSKQLIAPPELNLKDASGKPLVINAQSVTFSDNGSWLVVEVLGGSFTRINLGTLEMKPFAPAYGKLGSSGLAESSVAITPNGHYAVVENGDANEFKIYDLTNCSGSVCASYNYWPFVRLQVTGLRYISHVRFVNDGLISFDAATATDASSGTWELAPTSSIRALIDYLAVGDSYTSGEGAYDYLAGTDTGDNVCHLSSHSYPLLITHDLFTSSGGHSVACSGAVSHDIGDTRDTYRGQVRGVLDWRHLNQDQPGLLASVMANYLPGYVAQQRFVSQYQPGVLSIGIGGNNMGFSDILTRCIEPHSGLHFIANTCFATYEDRQEILGLISRTGQELRKLYQQLQASTPASSLYVIGYPQITVDNGDCALNVHFNTSELEFMHELVNAMNYTIASAATSAGLHYVDISQALAGHRLCETASYNVAVNGLTAGTDTAHLLGDESYHPNGLGQQLIEHAILTGTNNLRLSRSTPNPSPVAASLGFSNLPKSGRTIYALLPDHGLTSPQAAPGQSITVSINRLDSGLPPHMSYFVHIDGSQGAVLGTITDNSDSLTVHLASDIAPGLHTVDVIGQNQAGEPVDITQPVLITVEPVVGSCPIVSRSGLDRDKDGIDDACDAVIGIAPVGPIGANPSQVTTTTPPPTSTSSPMPLPVNNPLNQPPTRQLVQAAVGAFVPSDRTIIVTSPSYNEPAAVPTPLVVLPLTSRSITTGIATIRLSSYLVVRPNKGSIVRLPGLRVIHWLPWLLLAIGTLVSLQLLGKRDDWTSADDYRSSR